MKLKRFLSLILAFALSLSLFACGDDDGTDAGGTTPTDRYAELRETAMKNGDTYKYIFSEATEEDIKELKDDIPGITAAFWLGDASYNSVEVYKFSTSAEAESYKEEYEELCALYGYVTKLYDNVVAIGTKDIVEMLESGTVLEVPEWCEYKETRDTEGRELYTAKITVKDHGTITVLLDATTAPITVANFIKLANEGFYDGLTFHRVIQGFMIQGGCPNGNGTGSSDENITGEFSSNGYENDIKHIRGVISMARGNDPDSASCQFFICNEDASHLDGSYAAFGYVIDGMSVVDSITAATAKYGDSNGTIEIKALQAVIEKIEIVG